MSAHVIDTSCHGKGGVGGEEQWTSASWSEIVLDEVLVSQNSTDVPFDEARDLRLWTFAPEGRLREFAGRYRRV